jgi:hypothetical protein
MPALLLMCVAMSAHEAQAQHFISGNKLVPWMGDYNKASRGGCLVSDTECIENAQFFSVTLLVSMMRPLGITLCPMDF